jgi:hypothetical protein
VFGGTGRDFIYVKSVGAEVYGDTKDGLDPTTGASLTTIDPVSGARIDDKANADLFWFAPGVTIKDAGHHDILSFYGMPLTGGNIAVGGAFAEVVTSVAGIGGGTLALGGLASTVASGQGPFGGIFWDNLLPFITYLYDSETKTLYITNMVDAVSGLLFGRENGAFNGTGTSETKDLSGFMTIENFDFWGSYRGDHQSDAIYENGVKQYAGTLNMVFKQVNPVAAILDLLPPTAIGFATQLAFGGGNPLIDATFTLVAAASRMAKALKWADGTDPLVLDLDGNGIEFSELRNSRVYFDLDGDKFRERTAWLNGSDGFLAVDANNNGQIKEIRGQCTN